MMSSKRFDCVVSNIIVRMASKGSQDIFCSITMNKVVTKYAITITQLSKPLFTNKSAISTQIQKVLCCCRMY